MFLRTLRETRVGCVDVVLPDGTTERFGDLKPNAMSAKVTIKQDIVFERLIKSADLVRRGATFRGCGRCYRTRMHPAPAADARARPPIPRGRTRHPHDGRALRTRT